MKKKINVTIFNEHNQDREEPVKSIYPEGIHGAIARAFEGYEEFSVTIAGGEKLQVSRNKKKSFLTSLNEYLGGK